MRRQNQLRRKSHFEDSVDKRKILIEAAFPVTIKDAAEKDVVIEEKPEKIVSSRRAIRKLLFALGEGEAVLVLEDDNYPEEVAGMK